MSRAVFDKLSATLVVPIVVLPVAALLQAFGFILGLEPLTAGGRAILVHFLPALFALAVAVGFAGADAMAAFAALTAYAVMWGVGSAVARDPALNPGAIGGLAAGAVGVWLFRRFHRVELPEFLALFSGKRLVPTLAALAALPLGLLLGYGWPWVLGGLRTLAGWVFSAGPAGAFVYGAMDRILVPTGLHHIVNNLVEYQLGAYTDPATGRVVTGEIQRFYAGDPSAGLLMSGFYVFNNFAIPAIALAIAHAAPPSRRRRVSGLMWTGLLTSVMTGITEPVEFAFVFGAPVLWGVHVVLTGLASYITYALGIRDWGYALPMYVINWPYASRAALIPVVGVPFFVLYYALFRYYIARFRPPVLGQEADPGPGPAGAVPAEPGASDVAHLAQAVLAGLGGPGNLRSLDACMSRLRVDVADPAQVDEAALRRAGARGVMRAGTAVQVVLGPRAGAVRAAIEAASKPPAADGHPPAEVGEPAPEARPGDDGPVEVVLLSPLTGRCLPLGDVPDPAFANRLVGDGVAVAPEAGLLLAPAPGVVAHVFPGGHAVGIVTPEGLEVLLHVGVDTVKLGGRHFRVRVREGDRVRAGQVLVEFDREAVEGEGYSTVSPVVITNMDAVAEVTPLCWGPVRAGVTPVLRVRRR
ncbi:glucose PTS transporter subunit IIA [Caldinitratiruptor microaerophilus]|uniref:PTS N-acetyl glucosamine transporter subunit IIABC n=1 Tax=Caldinitratiruptor microaerophilus TaxID=671077 RepID=A0AA35CHT4_9FIRM|nr:glucose PTS transporter subunit IIA [Caldinitratiruptor microaerophilus]BDG59265.1 PTS N-acetyl glucosamine transporter subunit IIABC [Caldinitratiruptor microaerophilus]